MTESYSANDLGGWDKQFTWHPFTQMQAWCAPEHDPLCLVHGEGAWLTDSRGRKYLDGNSSIWTNLHGHNHPKLNEAIRAQLEQVAHTSYLGTANVPATLLARELVGLFPENTLTRVFYSDNGSTAIEAAMKMAVQYWQLTGNPERCRFAAFDRAYHGDTAGAASVGGIPGFFGRFRDLHFPVDHVASVEELESLPSLQNRQLAAVVVEPMIQGAAGMRLWPPGMLKKLREVCDASGTLLILDEVMTGFGRTGKMFACEQEAVVPDFLALGKGLSGGYLPLAATLTTEKVFSAFLGEVREGKTFYYGHSYTANPLGCAAALANLRIFREEGTLAGLQPKIAYLADLLRSVAGMPMVRAVRQCGFIVGIDLQKPDGSDLDWAELTGVRVCEAARAHGLLTRPILDTIVLMPPYCVTEAELELAVEALKSGMREVLA